MLFKVLNMKVELCLKMNCVSLSKAVLFEFYRSNLGDDLII
jgi:hypothetical protein